MEHDEYIILRVTSSCCALATTSLNKIDSKFFFLTNHIQFSIVLRSQAEASRQKSKKAKSNSVFIC